MRLAEAQKIATTEIKAILDEAGLENARTATSTDNTKIRYYYNRGEDISMEGTETLLIYGIASLYDSGKADGENFGYYIDIAIDIFTHQDGQSKKILDLLAKIEDAAHERGYSMKLDSQETYDNARTVQRLSYTLSRLIY